MQENRGATANTGRHDGMGRGQGDRPEAPSDTATYRTKVAQQIKKGKAVATEKHVRSYYDQINKPR